jgi:hypothetical protein
VFANDHTAQPYTALSDGEVRESSLISLLTSSSSLSNITSQEIATQPSPPPIDVEAARKAVLAEVIEFVRSAPQAVPLETLADRAVRIIGRDKTVATNWGGYGSFRDLLLAGLPDDIHLSDTEPYTVFDGNRHISASGLIAPQLPAPAADNSRRDVLADVASAEARTEVRTPLSRMQLQTPVAQAPAQQPMQGAFQSAPQPRYVEAQNEVEVQAPPMAGHRGS